MANRRELLQAGLAVAVLPVAAHAELVPAAPRLDTVPLYKVLYDTRFAASVAFGRRAESRGLAVQAMDGDMTRFWYQDLYHRWRDGPAPIAGLTAHGAMFCLERLAWDQRMRVVYRGEHAPVAGHRIAHRFEAPAALRLKMAATAKGGWPAALADVIAQCPRRRVPRSTFSVDGENAGAEALSEPLFSWVIAPMTRGQELEA